MTKKTMTKNRRVTQEGGWVIRIKLSGGPKDREWMEVQKPPPREISFVKLPRLEVEEWSGELKPPDARFIEFTRHYYELRCYATPRFGGRKFYRYVYRSK